MILSPVAAIPISYDYQGLEMADFTDVVLFLSSGRTTAWIGAGPSVEMGLPTWKGLAAKVLEACRRRQRYNFNRIEEHYQTGKYQEQFDEVALSHGTQFLHDVCSALVADPGGNGEIYTALVNLDFLSYFTTNYDDILYRHLEGGGKAVAVYRNSPEDIAAVDIDVTPALVKLHGDFSDTKSVVLTKSDYQKLYLSGDREDFQTFLRSHLARDRILFLGYSLSDPEIVALQERLAVNLRRNVAPIAILANATEADVDNWKRFYNVGVVPYHAHETDHSELVAMLKSVSNVLGVGKLAPTRVPDQDLRQAQALYLWHRFRPSAAGDASLNAIQSMIMVELVRYGGQATISDLSRVISESISSDPTAIGETLSEAVLLLVEAGWLSQSDTNIQVLPEGQQIVGQYERQFSDLMEVFTRQLSLDIKKDIDITEANAREFAQVVMDALIDLFELRGRDIMRMVWDDTPIGPQAITDLLQILWLRANTLVHPESRPSLVSFVLNILVNPTGIYENVLDYLSKAFFCIQAMRVDPEISRHLAQVVNDRSLLIDENVLIPLTARFEDRNEFVSEAIRTARDAGIKLYTTTRFVQTVRQHANWALNLVNEHGIQSEEVMSAALGEDGYTPNAFLKGFINQDPDDHNRELLQYVRECFGGSYERHSFDAFFKREMDITILDEGQLDDFIRSNDDYYRDAIDFMTQMNQTRPEEGRKSTHRIESEVEALLLVSKWDGAQTYVPTLKSSRCSFVTSGSSVPAIARNMNLVSGPMMIASVEMLWEILARLDSSNSAGPSFRSMMAASHFRMAGHFITPESVRRFFGPLIADAKKEFEEIRNFLGDDLSALLGDIYFDEWEEVQLPKVVSELQSKAVRQSTQRDKDQQRLLEENERLRLLVDRFEERERKRKEYAANQRNRSRGPGRNRRR